MSLPFDHRLFERLYEDHAAELLRYLFRRTGEASAAEDLVAIVFMTAWRRRADIRPETARAWLFGIATNVALTHRRAARRHRAALQRLAAARPPAPPEAVQLAEASVRELLDDLRRLPRRELDVLSLVVWSGLSYEEAGAALGIPVGTVRSRLARGRERLGRHRSERESSPIRPLPERNPS